MAQHGNRNADRIFVNDGRRAYRRKFSATELRIGLIVVAGLISILSWVAWKGAHPDPSLFMLNIDLSQAGVSSGAVDRGPMPAGLITDGWTEGTLSQFDTDNLYVKIDGRAGYYKSFGFQQLYFISLVLTDDAQTAVDLELYNMGTPANAIGAYSGERAKEAQPAATTSGLSHISRNALYLTCGRYYLRAIGSDESPAVISQLAHLKKVFQETLPAEDLPWGFAILVGGMGKDPGSIAFAPKNAFSFGFAKDVYSTTMHDDAELFVTPGGANPESLAQQYRDGFRQYGDDDGEFIKDRYLGTWATAKDAGPWVIGIRGATDAVMASRAIEEMSNIVVDIPLPQDEAEDVETEGAAESDEYKG